MIKNKRVLLLKSQSSDGTSDDYEDILTSNGFQVSTVKSLIFDYRNIDILKERLSDSSSYQGIIFCSPRPVHAVSLALANDRNLIEPWLEKNNFVIGMKTHKEALEKLGLDCGGRESGNAVNLSKIILEQKSRYDKPFLSPHGNLSSNELGTELREEGVEIEELLVYDTIANPDIFKELMAVTDNFMAIPEYVVLFSASGFRSSIDHLKKSVNFHNVKFIAFGPTTELAIKERGYHVHGVVKKPTPESLRDLLLQA